MPGLQPLNLQKNRKDRFGATGPLKSVHFNAWCLRFSSVSQVWLSKSSLRSKFGKSNRIKPTKFDPAKDRWSKADEKSKIIQHQKFCLNIQTSIWIEIYVYLRYWSVLLIISVLSSINNIGAINTAVSNVGRYSRKSKGLKMAIKNLDSRCLNCYIVTVCRIYCNSMCNIEREKSKGRQIKCCIVQSLDSKFWSLNVKL